MYFARLENNYTEDSEVGIRGKSCATSAGVRLQPLPAAPSTPELYLTNDNVCQGIAAMHMQDWAHEELHRLSQELKILGNWILTEIHQVDMAIYHCSGM
jgi:hypothetical protein